MTEYYAGFTEEDIEFLESIGRNVDDYERRTEMRDTTDVKADLCPLCDRRSKPFSDASLRRLARQVHAAEEAGYVMRKRWHCSNYRHNHRWKIGARFCNWMIG